MLLRNKDIRVMLKKIEDYVKVLIGGITYDFKDGVEIEDYIKAIFIDMFSNRATRECRILWNGVDIFISDIYSESVLSVKNKLMVMGYNYKMANSLVNNIK